MIRDEFLKQQKNKNLSNADLQGISSMGERAYYSLSLSKLKSTLYTMKISSIVFLVFAIISTVFSISILLKVEDIWSKWQNVLALVSAVLAWGFVIYWFCFKKPSLNKKIKRFQGYIKQLNDEEIKKQKLIYEKMKNNQS